MFKAIIAPLALVSSLAYAEPYNFNWVAPSIPCQGDGFPATGALVGPIQSGYYSNRPMIGRYEISIVPGTIMPLNSTPWDTPNIAITVTRIELAIVTSSPQTIAVMELGAGHAGPGNLDVACTVAAVGAAVQQCYFGGDSAFSMGASGDQHFDVYASCDTGSMSLRATVQYKITQ